VQVFVMIVWKATARCMRAPGRGSPRLTGGRERDSAQDDQSVSTPVGNDVNSARTQPRLRDGIKRFAKRFHNTRLGPRKQMNYSITALLKLNKVCSNRYQIQHTDVHVQQNEEEINFRAICRAFFRQLLKDCLFFEFSYHVF